ncbi:hypothetical protein BV898_03203 [Hypsibius exemplaris]|uniref:SUEL-type lectin domain-containing protein n=1 Tax=Hypsibius exemplaris TaxID=2072580 RepID=A0A1W0X5F8_HYPEX|nr:hypothetical protein BV898_03203 [Hypsibius exemplaris]
MDFLKTFLIFFIVSTYVANGERVSILKGRSRAISCPPERPFLTISSASYTNPRMFPGALLPVGGCQNLEIGGLLNGYCMRHMRRERYGGQFCKVAVSTADTGKPGCPVAGPVRLRIEYFCTAQRSVTQFFPARHPICGFLPRSRYCLCETKNLPL